MGRARNTGQPWIPPTHWLHDSPDHSSQSQRGKSAELAKPLTLKQKPQNKNQRQVSLAQDLDEFSKDKNAKERLITQKFEYLPKLNPQSRILVTKFLVH